MAYYRPRPDGLFELDTPSGPLPLPTTEEELRANGHVPDHLSMVGSGSGATADNSGAGGASGMGGPSPAISDAGNNYGQGGSPGQKIDQDIVSGAAGDPSVQKLSPGTEVVNMTRETQPLNGEGDGSAKRTGPKQERIPLSALGMGRGGGGAGGKAGFVPVSRTVKPGVEGLEDSIDKQNLERQAQYRIERDALPGQQARAERASGELGRNIRAEETALQEERDRRARINADLEERQKSIDTERQAIENLDVRPRDIFHGKGTLATALAAITMIGGAIGAAYQGGPNLATQALNKAVDDEIADQKDAELRREKGLKVRQTELGRLTDLYGSPEAAEQEFRIRAHTLIHRKAEKDALDAGATDALANLQARWSKDNQAFEAQKLELRGKLGDQVAVQERYSYPGAGGPGGGKPKKIGEAVRKQVAGYDAALAGLDDMESADNKHGNPTLLRTGGGFGATDAAQELAQIGNAIGPGIARATEGDAATKDSMDRAIGALTGHSAAERQRAREAYRRQIATARDRLLAAQGDIGDAPQGGGVPGEAPE